MTIRARHKATLSRLGRNGVPFSLLLAAACRGTDNEANLLLANSSSSKGNESQSDGLFSSLTATGNAIKGPLENAVSFLDFNNDGLLNKFRLVTFDENGNQSGYTELVEPQARTNTFGSFEIYTNIDPNADILLSTGGVQKASEARLATLTDENTIDRSSNQALPGVFLTAPAGSTVITPLTTLMDFADLTSDQLKSVVDLAADMPELNKFNQYAEDNYATAGVEIENFSQQFIATVTAYSGLLELSGLDATTAYQTTLEVLADIASDKSTSGSTLKLDDAQDLGILQQNLSGKLDTLNAANKSVFDQNSASLGDELLQLNSDIGTVTDLFTNEAKAQYAKAANLSQNVKQSILQNKASFDFSEVLQTSSGQPLGIGAKTPVTSIAGETGKKVTAPFVLYLDANEKIFAWSYFDQKSIDEIELVAAATDRLNDTAAVFSKVKQAPFDAESILLSNGMVLYAMSFRSDGKNETQISLVLMKKENNGNLEKIDEFIIPSTINEQNLDATLFEIGPNEFAVSWTSYNPNHSEHDIYAQVFKIDQDTNKIVADKVEFRINKLSEGNQTNVSLGQLKDELYAATWVSPSSFQSSHGKAVTNATEIYTTEFTRYGAEKKNSETVILTIYEDEYNNLQINSNLQVGSVSGKFMAYPATGITNTNEFIIRDFTIDVSGSVDGFIAPISLDVSTMITEDEIIKKFGENSTIKYKIISLEQDWRGVNEKWLQIDADTGVITGQPFLSKIGYNEVAGLLSAPEVRSGASLEFDVQSADSLLKALSQDTVFNIEKFANGLNTALKTLDVYTIEIMSEAVASQNLRLELKQNFIDILASFDENGALVPVTEADPSTGLRIHRFVDEFGTLRLESFDGAVLVGTELLALPELLADGANSLQGKYGTMSIDPNTGAYEYQLDGVEVRNALKSAPNGVLTETFDVKYATDNLVSAGVGGINFNPESISLADGRILTLWLNKFPVQDPASVTEYNPYVNYVPGTQVKYAPDLFDQSLKVKASLTDNSTHELKLSILGSRDDLILQIEVNGEVYQSRMIAVDGTRVDNPIIESIDIGSGTTLYYPGNYEYHATGQIDLSLLGGNIGWLKKASHTSLFSKYGEFIFDPISGKYDFKLKWGGGFEFQSAVDVYEYFSDKSSAPIEEEFDLDVGKVKSELLSEEGLLLFSSDVSFDGLMLSQETLTNRGEDLLRLEYDVLSLFPTGNFDPDAPLDFNVHSQRFKDAVSTAPSSALKEYESFGNYGSLIIDKNTGEYFYNLNTNIVRREMETGEISWDYDLDMEGLFAGEELLDIFHLTISNSNKPIFTSLKEVQAGQVPEIGTDLWIENTDQTQLMLSAIDADGQVIIEPIVIDDDFGYFTDNFDAELVSDKHILLAWTKANENEHTYISASYFDANVDHSDLYFEFKSNEFEVSQIAEIGQSNPRIASSADGDFSIVWEAYPFLTANDMENMDLVYNLYDIDALDPRATSYYEPEPDDNIIEDFNEFMKYLNDTKIFEVSLDKKISQLDQTKVQDYLEQLGDYIYYVDYGTDFYGLPEVL